MMKNTRLYTFAVLYADMLTRKKWRPKNLFTIQNGSHVISCLLNLVSIIQFKCKLKTFLFEQAYRALL